MASALTAAASDSGKRRNIADLGKWIVSLTHRIETPHLGALLGIQSAQQVFHIVISRLLTAVTELQVIITGPNAMEKSSQCPKEVSCKVVMPYFLV